MSLVKAMRWFLRRGRVCRLLLVFFLQYREKSNSSISIFPLKRGEKRCPPTTVGAASQLW